jgi:hypothetical protein
VPSKDPIQRFEDILDNAILILEFTKGMDVNSFLDDFKTRNATEPCLERIGEAARSWETWRRNCVRMFRGPTFARWATSCGTSTTESIRLASG